MARAKFEDLFQWAPTLGGECYSVRQLAHWLCAESCFNGHPPLGVNATDWTSPQRRSALHARFQWAPTLGGECYPPHGSTRGRGPDCFNGHPPLGVNATSTACLPGG